MADVNSARARNIAAIGAERSKARAAVLRTLHGRDYAATTDRAAALLADPDDVVASIRLERFLRAVGGLGGSRIDRLMHRAELRPARLGRKIGELTDRERRVIAAVLAATFTEAA